MKTESWFLDLREFLDMSSVSRVALIGDFSSSLFLLTAVKQQLISSASTITGQHRFPCLLLFLRQSWNLPAARHNSRVRLRACCVLCEHPAAEYEWRQGDAAGQLLDVAGQLHGLELRDPSQLHRLGRGDDGDVLGHFKGPLQLLGTLGAEELVDGHLHLLQVAVDHAEARHVQDDGDGEGHQAHKDKVEPQAAVGVRHAHHHCVVPRQAGAAQGQAGVTTAVLEGDHRDVQVTVLMDLPLSSSRSNI